MSEILEHHLRVLNEINSIIPMNVCNNKYLNTENWISTINNKQTMKFCIYPLLLNLLLRNVEQDIQNFKPHIIWFDIHWDITVWMFLFQLEGVEWVEIENNRRVNKTYECWHIQLLEVIFDWGI